MLCSTPLAWKSDFQDRAFNTLGAKTFFKIGGGGGHSNVAANFGGEAPEPPSTYAYTNLLFFKLSRLSVFSDAIHLKQSKTITYHLKTICLIQTIVLSMLKFVFNQLNKTFCETNM